MDKNIKELISKKEISDRVKELGAQISKEYKDKQLTIIGVSNGALIFFADLIREITIPIKIDTITASSYIGSESSGTVNIASKLKLEIKNHNVILVDDILDTGRTLLNLTSFLNKLSPNTIKTCVLLDKPARRVEKINADIVGFEIPDEFVIGYGLDYDEYYRNLPYIGILEL